MQNWKVIDHIVTQLVKELCYRKCQNKRFGHRISGGIDSAVTSTLCAQKQVFRPIMFRNARYKQTKQSKPIWQALRPYEWVTEKFQKTLLDVS